MRRGARRCATLATLAAVAAVLAVAPGTAQGPAPETETHDEPELDIQEQAPQPQDRIVRHEWTQGPENATITVEPDIDNGTATITIIDGANVTLFQQAFGAAHDGVTLPSKDAVPGNWTVQIEEQDLLGGYRVHVTEAGPQPPSGPVEPVEPPEPGFPADPPETGDPPGNDAAAPAVALILIAVAALGAIVARRRRADRKA